MDDGATAHHNNKLHGVQQGPYGGTIAHNECHADHRENGTSEAMSNHGRGGGGAVHEEAVKQQHHHQAKKKKPYKELTLEEKVELIRLAERCSNLSQASIAERYAIAKSNVCRILQRKEEYVRALESAGFAGSRKRKLRAVPSSGGAIAGPLGMNCSAMSEGGRIGEQHHHRREEEREAEEEPVSVVDDDDESEKGGGDEGGGGGRDNDALRAHMSAEHQMGRVFLCRCCNWAFRDKNELHEHLKQRRERSDQQREEEMMAKKEEAEEASSREAREATTAPTTNAIEGSENEQQKLLMANLWGSILLSQHRLQQINGGGEQSDGRMEGPNGMPMGSRMDISQFTHNLASIQPHQHHLQQVPMPPTATALPLIPNKSNPSSIPSSVIVQNGGPTCASSSSSSATFASTTNPPLMSTMSLPLGSSSDSDSELSSHSQTISPSQSDGMDNNSNNGGRTQQQSSNHHRGQPPQHLSTTECVHCSLLKPRLTLAQARCSYLEATNISFQSELLRSNAKSLLAEQCIRRLEMELRQWRERNDLLRFRLLECREKMLAVLAGGAGSTTTTADLSKFVGDVLKITLI